MQKERNDDYHCHVFNFTLVLRCLNVIFFPFQFSHFFIVKTLFFYTGQKGIGFKSVFKVTDCPEIHSNDFHIQFDKASGPMGYILPHWVEEERPVPSVAKEIAEKRFKKRFIFLFKHKILQCALYVFMPVLCLV